MKQKKNIVAIVQARTGSTRFPDKVFAKLSGKSLIWHIINRLKYSKRINEIVLATTINSKDDGLIDWAEIEGIKSFRGSEDDVLARFYEAAKVYKADIIVRITADDPFKDPEIIDNVIAVFEKRQLDFAYNNNPPSFPEGLDVEVFSFAALEKAALTANDFYEKEHVTQFFYRNKKLFKCGNVAYAENISNLRWTIDTETDYNMALKVYEALYEEGKIFLMNDILNLFKKDPSIALINSEVPRSLMYK